MTTLTLQGTPAKYAPTPVTVRYTRFNRRGELVTADKRFASEAAMERWLDRTEDENFVQVLAYSFGD